MNEVNAVAINTDGLTWFTDSPPPGPECTCSVCGAFIPESDAPVIRMFRNVAGEVARVEEARFHQACFQGRLSLTLRPHGTGGMREGGR